MSCQSSNCIINRHQEWIVYKSHIILFVGQQKQTLDDFCTAGLSFYNGKSFNPSDKDRFYEVDSQDGSTVVALSELKLTGDQGYNEVINFISRTVSGIHAEENFIDQAAEVIKEARKKTNLTEMSLVTMSTRSPCSKCRNKLTDFLTQWGGGQIPTVKFTLRISELYHETRLTGNRESNGEVTMKIQLWKEELIDCKVVVRLEPISVKTELPGYETKRQKKCDTCPKSSEECNGCRKETHKKKETSKKKRETGDADIKKHVEQINSNHTQKKLTGY